ncbi:MAG: glucose 1-dehydrogenase [Candidatus Eremiobacteraeota bacterium]|nr:glucose 1-dehydrogenase [Candidatus Eremiobacteraeota bacterium]
MEFSGRSALITGASRGIGRAIAVEFSSAGAELALLGRDRAALEETRAACLEVHPTGKIEIVVADVAQPDASAKAVETALERFGRLDFAIANAGQAVDGLILRLRHADVDRLIDVNLKSALYLAEATAKPMLRQRGGSIVFVSSIVALVGNAGQSIYAATKAGLLGLTKSLAKELGSRGVRVNAVAPGYIETAMTTAMPEAAKAQYLNTIPLGRPGRPQDVSGVVRFLCSDAAAYVTGQTLVVDGGLVTY